MPVQNVQYKLLQKYPNYYWWANLITLVWSFNGLFSNYFFERYLFILLSILFFIFFNSKIALQ